MGGPAALGKLGGGCPGRWPRLRNCAPLALWEGLFSAVFRTRERGGVNAAPRPSSGNGRLVNALDGGIKLGVEFRVGLQGGQAIDQRPRKARYDAVVFGEALVGFRERITA